MVLWRRIGGAGSCIAGRFAYHRQRARV